MFFATFCRVTLLMCFNFQTSFVAWLLSVSISIYLIHRNRNYDRWNAMFIITFTTIQLLEGLMWLNFESNSSLSTKDNINSMLTKVILLALLTQPLVQSYFGYKFTGAIFLQVLTYIFLAILIWGFLLVLKPNSNFHTTIGPNGHLVWNRDRGANKNGGSSSFVPMSWLYLLGLFIPLLFMKDYRGIPLIAVGLGTFAYSWYYTTRSEFSSMWCITSVIYALVAIVV